MLPFLSKRVMVVLFLVILICGCQKESFYTGDNCPLTFSTDTLSFDTVFTSIGSATLNLTVYNPLDQDVRINRIGLSSNSSFFRLNIDGDASNYANNITLKGRDSLIIFVEVTVDPMDSDSPVFIKDSIEFLTNNNTKQVVLSAFGQDVVKFKNKHLSDTTLTSKRPFLIYDTLFIQKNSTVNITEGSRFYMYKGALLYVDGTLQINGNKNDPILFTGSRTEEWYQNAAGMWEGIYLSPLSRNNQINYLSIKNAENGLICDSVGLHSDTLLITNTRIEHTSTNALSAHNSVIRSANLLIGNSSQRAISIQFGGYYEFGHCTISNYSNDNISRYTPSIYINNYLEIDGTYSTNPLKKAWFNNSIIAGGNSQEIEIDCSKIDGEPFDGISYLFENSMLNISKTFSVADTTHFKKVILNKDPKFVNRKGYDYHLDSISPAINAGNKNMLIPFYQIDLDGKNRFEDNNPDLGIYEYSQPL